MKVKVSSDAFSFLKDYVNTNSLSDLSVDFEPALLAYEVAAKVAVHAADCYKETYTLAKTEKYHAGNQAQIDRKYRIKHAKDLTDQAVSKYTVAVFTPTLRTNQEKITKAATTAHKDNDFVYHEQIPDPKTLETILAQPITKPLPPRRFNPTYTSYRKPSDPISDCSGIRKRYRRQ
ncbi:unnamed protein product [Rotaria sordida]|uniref:BRO1 domain-containing protein n=1 Tax=Rotaria sordida TaxID=392033 RepID=A0A819KP71_9BILA|nr:unnamed protein product [Rotaria sordida]CAF3952482.1 unnamed protein product [Rotaria sordida]